MSEVSDYATCPCGCGQRQDAGLLAASCTDRLEALLRSVPSLVEDLDVALSKMARIGSGGAGGLARERNPVHWGAVEAGDVLGNVLSTWVRDIYREDLTCAMHGFGTAEYGTLLLGAIDAIRRHPAVDELVEEVTDAIGQARRAIDLAANANSKAAA